MKLVVSFGNAQTQRILVFSDRSVAMLCWPNWPVAATAHYDLASELEDDLGLVVDMDPENNELSYVRLPEEDTVIGTIVGDADAVIR